MQVQINDKLNKAWNMDFVHKEISVPQAKTNYVSIPLSDGDMDLTEVLSGQIRYKNRKIVMDFEIRADRREWPMIYSGLQKEYNGRNVVVVFHDDPGYEWHGRATVGQLQDKTATAGIRIEVNAAPFKRERHDNEKDVTVSGTKNVTISCQHMRGYPLFTVSTAMTVNDGRETYSISPASEKAYGLEFKEGNNELTFTGSGTVKIRWRGGDL